MAVLCLITALFCVWLLYVQRSARQQTELLLSVNINSKNTGFDRILKLEGSPFEAFVYDFSCRDDLFAYMEKPGASWADQYLASLYSESQQSVESDVSPEISSAEARES